jgi:predicted HTH domain antitoxin
MSQGGLQLPASVSEAEAKLLLAIKLYELGRFSTGQAAEFAGYSKRAFMEILGKHGIAVFDHPPSEIENDLKHA